MVCQFLHGSPCILKTRVYEAKYGCIRSQNSNSNLVQQLNFFQFPNDRISRQSEDLRLGLKRFPARRDVWRREAAENSPFRFVFHVGCRCPKLFEQS